MGKENNSADITAYRPLCALCLLFSYSILAYLSQAIAFTLPIRVGVRSKA
jgi:hypothetical protein